MNTAFHFKELPGAVAKTPVCVCFCVCVCVYVEVGDDEGQGMEPGGKKKTTLEEVIALLMREKSSLSNMQICPVPSPGSWRENIAPSVRSWEPPP